MMNRAKLIGKLFVLVGASAAPLVLSLSSLALPECPYEIPAQSLCPQSTASTCTKNASADSCPSLKEKVVKQGPFSSILSPNSKTQVVLSATVKALCYNETPCHIVGGFCIADTTATQPNNYVINETKACPAASQ